MYILFPLRGHFWSFFATDDHPKPCLLQIHLLDSFRQAVRAVKFVASLSRPVFERVYDGEQ